MRKTNDTMRKGFEAGTSFLVTICAVTGVAMVVIAAGTAVYMANNQPSAPANDPSSGKNQDPQILNKNTDTESDESDPKSREIPSRDTNLPGYDTIAGGNEFNLAAKSQLADIIAKRNASQTAPPSIPKATYRLLFSAQNASSPMLSGHSESEVKIYDGIYHLYYRTDNGEIGLVTSVNGVNWEDRGVVLEKDADVYVASPSVEKSGSTYYLFYEGNNGDHSEIGYATATSPLGPFVKNPNTILQPQGIGFESQEVGTPAVMKLGTKWYLFYHGSNGSQSKTALAWSSDLTSWTRHPQNPILASAHPLQSNKIAPSSTYSDAPNGYTYIAFEGRGSSEMHNIGIAYVKTTDLETSKLTIQQTNPLLLASSNGWDNNGVRSPSLFSENDGIYLYYSGHDYTNDTFGLGRTKLTISQSLK